MARYNTKELIKLEQNIIDRYNNNELPFLFHLCGGNEDQLIDIFNQVEDGDWVLSTHRNHYHAYLHGIPPHEIEKKVSNGRSMFIYDKKRKFFSSAIVGGIPEIAAGIALALKRKKSSNKVWCFVGDGCEDTGHFAEAVRYVDGWNLPCKFVVEDNDISIMACKKDRWGDAHTPEWPECVQRYHYTLRFPHCRTNEFCDLSVTNKIKKTDEEYFPLLPETTLPETNIKNVEGLSYGEAVTKAMANIGNDNSIFLGYNLGGKFGNAMGTLAGVRDDIKIETPVAENLMGSLALGASLEGFKAVVYYERHDFMLVAADVIGNHISQLERISHGEFKPNVILRTVVADAGPFYSGPTHSQDLTKMFKELVSFPVLEPRTPEAVLNDYKKAQLTDGPVMVVERKSCYDG
jgi:hypothetical protein